MALRQPCDSQLPLSDWSHIAAEVEAVAALSAPSTLDNGLINGINTYNNSGTIVADTHFKFSIDNHTMEVIAADLVPIVPYTSDTIAISMGQRYDIIVTAYAAVDNYWIRAVAQTICSKNVNADNIYGIIKYDSTSIDDPTSVRWANASTDELCEDELMSSLDLYVPIVASDSPAEADELSVIINKTNGVIWQIGTHSFLNQWNYPTLLQSYKGNDTWAPEQEVYQLPEANFWVH
ncbi:hypothetical protein BTUL_0068g00020 [Botrytis tulipae]|uniref:Plastocyanin-like domain-containing protein n=1 Tax=Botrytis tulipae TaxID=87230 RepID=A0A4Z1EME8_9HELO|nr:hypothetical protein BTUL_0068g00020 [Botrytis tulipae]